LPEAGQQPIRSGLRRAAAGRAGQPREHRQREEGGRSRHAGNHRDTALAGEPDTCRQRDDSRRGGHDPEEAEAFASPLRRQQRRGEGAADNGAEAESEAADDADRYHDGRRAPGQQGQSRRSQQQHAGREQGPGRVPPHQEGRGELRGHGAQQEHACHEPGSRAAGAGGRGIPGRDRKQQVETGERAELRQEHQRERDAQDALARRGVAPGRPAGLRQRHCAHVCDRKSEPDH
jgi:hypothetical protein